MKLPSRLESALSKLYEAFNEDRLHPEDACCCAVGNILNNSDHWKHLSDHHGSKTLNYVGKVHEMLGRRFEGYLPSELLQIEIAFLKGCGYELPFSPTSNKPLNPKTPDTLFNGLSNVVALLCKLEGVPHVMELTAPFREITIKGSSEVRQKNIFEIVSI